jgi:hypothetical protein
VGYRKLPEIPRAERTKWSPERGGRNWQLLGKTKVKKYSFSPFTAKPRTRYTFYADIEMLVEIESPPGSGQKRKFFTVPATVGTYLEFRDEVLSGEIREKLEMLVAGIGGGQIVSVGYWRNSGLKGEQNG